MPYFWEDIDGRDAEVAFIDNNSEAYSYNQLNKLVCDVTETFFRSARDLVFLYSSNNISAIACYLSCLKAGNPVLLLDESLDESFKANLVNIYQPNLVIRITEDGKINADRMSDTVYKMGDDLAVLLSTSGSTGEPKLVKLSKQNIQSNAESISTYLNLQAVDRAISLLPFHYSYGLSILNTHIYGGASMVLTAEGVMSRTFWDLFKSHKVTSISGVPYIYEILDKLRFSRMSLPSLRYMTQAGGKLSTKLVEQFAKCCEQINIPFYVMYGQTEATARISYLNPEIVLSKTGSIGKAIPGGRLSLINTDGEIISAPGDHGELVYEGLNVMIGYAETLKDLRQASADLKVLKTGDIAYFDEDGDFFIVGRTKRFIKLFGLRFSLDQMEKCLNDAGYSCICGGADDMFEVACLDAGQGEKLLKEFVSRKYKININAINVFYLPEIPRVSSGKIDYKSIFK